MSFSVAPRAVLLPLIALVMTACSGSSTAQPASAAAAPQTAASGQAAPPAAPNSPAPPLTIGSLPNFAPLVERYGPAVVNVEVVQKVQTAGGPGPQGMTPDNPLYDFFRRFGIPAPDMGPRGDNGPARGSGSGFIITSDGYVVTNAHVVADADTVTVRLTDRREFIAKVIGSDITTDIAVLKIDARNMPTVTIGDPNQLKPGEWVLAIGSPFGFENSATAGIVSATSRSLGPESNYVRFIQTDVAVNPGNSGGPLFNMRGEVIGINSQIFSRTGGYMGLSFAIPIDLAMNVREQLIKTGRVVRGRIGVTIQEVTAQLSESFGLPRPYGALVSSVETDGPGDKAGLEAGDVIVSVNGKPIERNTELPGIIAMIKPGEEAKLGVWRGGKERTVSVKIAELQDRAQQAANPRSGGRGQQPNTTTEFGLAVRPLAPEEKEQMETDGQLVVEQVTGPAAQADVRPGDVILGVNGVRVKTVTELQAAAKKSGKNVALLIQRAGQQIFVPIRIG